MRRGEFIAIVCGAALSLPFPAQAQQSGKVPRIAFLATPDASTKQRVACFKDGLRGLGWIEGQNIAIDVRVSDGSIETNRSLVAELNALKFDLIVSYGTPSTQVMRQAIQNTPVLFLMVSDPVASGIVSSLARPGGNITGISNFFTGYNRQALGADKGRSPGSISHSLHL